MPTPPLPSSEESHSLPLAPRSSPSPRPPPTLSIDASSDSPAREPASRPTSEDSLSPTDAPGEHDEHSPMLQPWDSQEFSDDPEPDSDLEQLGPGPSSAHADGWDQSWDEQPPSSSRPAARVQSRERERRRRNRRVYGGGRHRHGAGDSDDDDDDEDSGGGGTGEMGVGEVGGLVLAGALSPLPLLLPSACYALSPSLFVPLLAISGALGWASAVTVGVEGRYVGARSYPALASAVFPHRFKLHRLGELLASAFILGGSIVRTTLGVVAGAEVTVDLLVPEQRRRDWERTVAVGVISAIWVRESSARLARGRKLMLSVQLCVPLFLPPLLRLLGLASSSHPSSAHYTRLSSAPSPNPDAPYARPRWTALLRLPAYSLSFLTWPLALLILGVRLKRLNRDALTLSSLRSLSNSNLADKLPALNPTDAEGASLWPAILLTFSALSSTSHETFYYLTSLARPSSTASRKRAREAQQHQSALSFATDEPVPSTAAAAAAHKEGKRNQYPLAIAIGLFLAFLIELGWALVGTLGVASPTSSPEEQPAPAGNFLSDPRLPRGDAWLGCVRVLVLVGIFGQLEGHARVGIKRVRRGIQFFLRSPPAATAGSGSASASQRWLKPAVGRSVVWVLVAALSLVVVAVPVPGRRERKGKDHEVGGHGEGLVYLAEWSGVVLGGLGSCLVPAIAYLTLFHLRRPRSIFTSDPRSPHFSTDALLQRKERQVQRRLSGRRVWTDVGVFGVLGPVGVVVLVRGVVALVG
ncbi:hypothetical protein JCM21900_004757 [Sporobolomyces salmonicolor]